MPSIPVVIQGTLLWEGSGGPVDPGFGQGVGPIFRPDQGLPGGRPVRPDNGLPVGPPGSIGTLPVFPWDPTDPGFGVGRPDRPDQGLPGSGGHPDQGLPPTAIRPGLKFVVKWLACTGLILVPDQELPETPEPK